MSTAHTDRLTRIPLPRSNTVADLHMLVINMNREVTQLRNEVRTLKSSPKLSGHLDMQGHRIINVGRTEQQNDVPPRVELIDKALYDNGLGQHIARSPIIATSGIRGKRNPEEPNEMATVQWVRNLLKSVTSSFNTTFLPQRLTLSSGSNDDITLDPGTVYVVQGPASAYSITGFDGGEDGQLVILVTTLNQALTIVNESGSSVAANRIQTLANTGADILTNGPGVFAFLYDDTTARWLTLWSSLT